MQKHFEVTVEGQYHAISDISGTPTLKNYRETFILPSQEAALSTICKHLLSPRLKKSHADFVRYRTHNLVSMNLKNYKPNPEVLQMSIDDMNLLELSDFCILRQLMIDPYKHGAKDIFNIRQMVQKAYSDQRQAKKDKAESKDAVIAAEADTLRRANDLPPVADEPLININEQKLKAPAATKPIPPQSELTSPSEFIEPSDDPLPPPEQDDPNAPILE